MKKIVICSKIFYYKNFIKSSSIFYFVVLLLLVAINAEGQPGDFQLVSPSNTSEDVDVWPLFEWKGSTGATHYSLQIGTSPNFSEGTYVSYDSLYLTAIRPPIDLIMGETVYYWRVKAYDEQGNSVYNDASNYPYNYWQLQTIPSTEPREVLGTSPLEYDRTLITENTPYIMRNGDITIPETLSLRVRKGITINIEDGVGIMADGTLNMFGEENAPITLTRFQNSTGYWKGIKDADTLIYVDIKYSNGNTAYGDPYIIRTSSEAFIAHCTIKSSNDPNAYGIRLNDGTVSNSLIDGLSLGIRSINGFIYKNSILNITNSDNTPNNHALGINNDYALVEGNLIKNIKSSIQDNLEGIGISTISGEVNGNHINDCQGGNDRYIYGIGVYSSQGIVRNNLIRGCGDAKAFGGGIYLDGGADTYGNYIDSCYAYEGGGIYSDGPYDKSTLEKDTIINCSASIGAGIYIKELSSLITETVSNNSGGGIFTEDDLNVENCVITNNENYGLHIYGEVGVKIINSIIKYNSGNGIIGSPDAINNSSISNNSPYNIRMGSSKATDATNNWWLTRSDEIAIEESIWDGDDDYNLGLATYQPILTDVPPTLPGIFNDADILMLMKDNTYSQELECTIIDGIKTYYMDPYAPVYLKMTGIDNNPFNRDVAVLKVTNLNQLYFIRPFYEETTDSSGEWKGTFYLSDHHSLPDTIPAVVGDTLEVVVEKDTEVRCNIFLTDTDNNIPVVSNPIDDINLTEGFGTYTMDIESVFTDPDGDSLSYSATSDSTQVVDVAFSGEKLTIIEKGKGLSNITVTADDGSGGVVQDEFQVMVKTNEPPVVVNPLSDIAVSEGFGNKTIDISNVFQDGNGDNLSYFAESDSTEVVTVNVSQEYLTIYEAGTGTSNITVIADDGNGKSATDSFEVYVNSRPVLKKPISDIDTSKGFGSYTIDISDVFNDSDGDQLSYSIVNNASDLVAASLSDTKITLTEKGVGTGYIILNVDDGNGGTNQDQFYVSVTYCSANSSTCQEYIKLVQVGSIHNITNCEQYSDYSLSHTTAVDIGNSYSIKIAVGNGTGNELVGCWIDWNQDYDFNDAGENISLQYSEDTAHGNINIPLTSKTGKTAMRIRIQSEGSLNPCGITSSGEVEDYSINPQNTSPTVINPIQDLKYNEGFNRDTIDISDVFTDSNGHELTFSVYCSNQNVIAASVSGTELILSEVGRGNVSITIRAKDAYGAYVDDLFEVEVNSIPVIINPMTDLILYEGFEYHSVDISNVFSDSDGDNLNYTLTNDATNVISTVISGTNLEVSEIETGEANITITADDGNDGVVSDSFKINVHPNNQPEVINPISDVTLSTGFGTHVIDISSVFTDQDGDQLTYSIAIKDTTIATGSISGTDLALNEKGIGETDITVTAKDDIDAECSDTFNLTINEKPNTTPELNIPIPDTSIIAKVNYNYQIPSNTFVDADGDDLNYSASGVNNNDLPSWLSFDEGNRTFYGTPQSPGEHRIIVIVTDTHNSSARDTFNIKVMDNSTGLEDKYTCELNIYPNPANEYLNIEFEQLSNIEKVKIVNLIGKTLYERESLSDIQRINLSDMPANIYILQIYTKKGIISTKIIKN